MRVVLEDGAIYYMDVTYISVTQLLLHFPPHPVPLHMFGLLATMEVAHHSDENGHGTIADRYWQVISRRVNDPREALRVQYYGQNPPARIA